MSNPEPILISNATVNSSSKLATKENLPTASETHFINPKQLHELKLLLRENVYDIISTIKDPEFPTRNLGELRTSVKRPSRTASSQNDSLYDEANSSVDDSSAKGEILNPQESDKLIDNKFVINEEDIHIQILGKRPYFTIFVKIVYTPTVAHCSLTSLIGLCLLAKMKRDFPINCHDSLNYFESQLNNQGSSEDAQNLKYLYKNLDQFDENNLNYKIKILVFPGSHSTEAEVNRQVNDKERVSAAFESKNLVAKIEELIEEVDEDYEKF